MRAVMNRTAGGRDLLEDGGHAGHFTAQQDRLDRLMRRVQRVGPGNGQVIEMIGSRALGPRDRLVLVQVGEEQILLGITPGRITPLHVLKTPVSVDQGQSATPEFAQRLMELLGKDQKDKK